MHCVFFNFNYKYKLWIKKYNFKVVQLKVNKISIFSKKHTLKFKIFEK